MNTILNNIFSEASKDYGTTEMHGSGYEAYMKLGIKISRDSETNDIKLYDHSAGGNYYVEMGDQDKQLILDEGWSVGVLKITLDKYKEKLERIKKSISKELNGNNSKKRLNYFKESRQQILNKYYKIIQKIKSYDN